MPTMFETIVIKDILGLRTIGSAQSLAQLTTRITLIEELPINGFNYCYRLKVFVGLKSRAQDLIIYYILDNFCEDGSRDRSLYRASLTRFFTLKHTAFLIKNYNLTAFVYFR